MSYQIRQATFQVPVVRTESRLFHATVTIPVKDAENLDAAEETKLRELALKQAESHDYHYEPDGVCEFFEDEYDPSFIRYQDETEGA